MVKGEKTLILWGFTEKLHFDGQLRKKQHFFWGGPSQFADLRGGSAKKRGWVFLRGNDTPKHTMLHFSCLY